MASSHKEQKEVVVITGASAGIGRATALAFARSGAAVALLARSRERLEELAREIEGEGGRALAITLDVADADQVERAAQQIEIELGPIHIWVNNAMATVFSRATDMTAQEYARVTEVTYLGTVHGTLAALKYMRPRNYGTIIQVGSALAYRGIPLQSAYCAAKFAVRGFTDSLRVELMHENSRVHLTMVQLAAFNTPQFDWARCRTGAQPRPLAPIFQPEVAADAILWSARHRRRELYVGFPALKAVIGNKLLPSLLDRVLCRRAISGQMDFSMPVPETGRDDNLFSPVESDFGAHGRFDAQARNGSLQLMLTQQRRLILGVAVAVAGIATLAGGVNVYKNGRKKKNRLEKLLRR